jgi:hypothetical protein
LGIKALRVSSNPKFASRANNPQKVITIAYFPNRSGPKERVKIIEIVNVSPNSTKRDAVFKVKPLKAFFASDIV